jgi:2-amino-4-hydroxy-6-hydroxymethyldihydropteridine diphosphokinase
MSLCLIALGSNLGDRVATLDAAVRRLGEIPGIAVLKSSRWHETAPVGGPAGQGKFLNGAVLLETSLSPEELLAALRRVETDCGRGRDVHWGPRTLDLDLLLYDDLVYATADLAIPHPRMAWRRFVLQPAAEVAPEMVHPTSGWTVGQLLEHLDSSPPYLAIADIPGRATSALARQVAAALDARLLVDEVTPRWLSALSLDPSGGAAKLPLEFLDHVGPRLTGDAAQRSERFTVSDFWFDQAEAYAAALIANDELPAFRRRQAAYGNVMRPRLTVVWDHPPWLSSIAPAAARGPLDLIRQAIVSHAARPGHGPVLWLNNDDEASAVAKVLAAVESMK